jgi:hypothetical protein
VEDETRMYVGNRLLLAALGGAFLFSAGLQAEDLVRVEVTQKRLVPLCLDTAPVPKGQRTWGLTAGEHTLAASMQNTPRSAAVKNAQSGTAVVRFRLEAGHKYEVEVQASNTSFSEGVWPRGEWTPVVRDRTRDKIVSDPPKWVDTACGAQPR